MMSGPSRGTSNDSKPLTAGGCLIRLLWLLVGPAILVLSATVIAQHRGTFLSWADAVFGGTVLLLIAIRHLDLRHFGGLTGTGEPATVGQWRRYCLSVVALGLLLWAAGHAAAHLGLFGQ